MLQLVQRLRELEARAAATSAKSKPLFDKRGQLLPRERAGAAARPGLALPRTVVAGRLPARQPRPARRSVPGGGMIAGIGYRQRRALHGRGQRFRHRRRRHPAAWAATRCCACQDIALREQAALRAAGRIAPAPTCCKYKRRGLRPRRRPVLQPGAAVGRGHAGGRPWCTARPPPAAPTCPACRDYVIMVRGRAKRLPRRPAAAEGRHRRDRHRGGTGRRRDAHQRLGPGRIPGRGRRRRACASRAR